MQRLLIVVVSAVLAAGCASGGSKQSTSKEGESKSSLISDLQGARLEASTLSARKLMFTKVKGPLSKGDSAETYAAYYQGEVLRVIEDQANYGERGESERGYFLDSQGRLFYYTGRDERVKQSGKDKPSTEKLRVRVAYDETGKVIGSEKTVNGQPANLSEADLKAIRARLQALRKVADAAKPK
jgi:hypothetical protein